MSTDPAYKDDIWEEVIDGKIVAMSPRPSVGHIRVSKNITKIFDNFLYGRICEYFPDGTELHLSDDECYIPDGMVICDPNKVKGNGIYGAPDLVIEVLSPSTVKNDRIHKRDVYELFGVKEYWIVDPKGKSVEQYLLNDGKLSLSDVYTIYPDWMLEKMSDEKKSQIATEFRCSLYDDLIIKLDDIFYRVE